MRTASSTERPAKRRTTPADVQGESKIASLWQSTWAPALAGSVLLWLALPPVSWSLLAWVAPVPWVLLVRRQLLAGWRPYVALWLTSFAFWMATLHWLTLPHWATSFGWIAISAYLAFYFPGFIGLSRVAVRGLRVSPLLAAPVVWTALELIRLHLLSGFGMALLSHTQYRWPIVLQLSDLAGAYGVSFAMMFVATCLARMLPCDGATRAWWPLVPLAAMLASVLAYGNWRLGEPPGRPGPQVALIQGSIDIEMKHDPTQLRRIFEQYFELSVKAIKEHPGVELIVWPETMFPYPWYTVDPSLPPAPNEELPPEDTQQRSREAVVATARALRTPLLLGISTFEVAGERLRHYNSALFVDRNGDTLGRYDKTHLVLFGEYVPLAETFPWLYRLTPLPGGLDAGREPLSVRVGQTQYAPNICYENTVPHLLREQIVRLRRAAAEPDLLVTLTNDGWFWGSSELDMHLACGVFRAIECRKPLLIAANTGFSAWIDADGQIRSQGPRRETDVMVVAPESSERHSWYLEQGDLFAGACLSATCAVAVVGLVRLRRGPETGK
jgi:apolipoprotein N-acyltransferase